MSYSPDRPSNAYPRDLVGYGRTPPHANWPGNAKIAVQFVLNYEEGGENCVLHGDAGSEQFLSVRSLFGVSLAAINKRQRYMICHAFTIFKTLTWLGASCS